MTLWGEPEPCRHGRLPHERCPFCDHLQPYGGKPPHNTTPTSVAASESMADKAPSVRAQVLTHIGEHPEGLTCEEIETLMPGHSHQSVSARIRELSLMGAVYHNGTRPNPRSGRQARVYYQSPF